MATLELTRPLIDEEAAARLLGMSVQTLRNWRCTGRRDLPFVRCGRSVRYRPEDVEQFVTDNTVGGEKN